MLGRIEASSALGGVKSSSTEFSRNLIVYREAVLEFPRSSRQTQPANAVEVRLGEGRGSPILGLTVVLAINFAAVN